jgi:hypothetical protein
LPIVASRPSMDCKKRKSSVVSFFRMIRAVYVSTRSSTGGLPHAHKSRMVVHAPAGLGQSQHGQSRSPAAGSLDHRANNSRAVVRGPYHDIWFQDCIQRCGVDLELDVELHGEWKG